MTNGFCHVLQAHVDDYQSHLTYRSRNDDLTMLLVMLTD